MKKRWIYGTLCLIWMFVIFGMSNAQGEESQGMSDTIVIFLSKLLPFVSYNDTWTFIIRKLAHFSEYAILGMLYYLFLSTYHTIYKKQLVILVGCVFLYACSDEFHQLFMEGRAGQFRDVCIDTAGGTTGILIWHMLFTYYRKFKETKAMKHRSL